MEAAISDKKSILWSMEVIRAFINMPCFTVMLNHLQISVTI